MTISAPSRPAAANRPRVSMSTRTRRTALAVHVVSSGAWIGIDVITALLVAVGWISAPELRDVVYNSLAQFFIVPATIAGLVSGVVCLISGIVLGLGTKWGLLRYWWVTVKLVLNVVACAVLVTILFPVNDFATGQQPIQDMYVMFYLAMAAFVVVLVAMVLSVFKPWGRLRR